MGLVGCESNLTQSSDPVQQSKYSTEREFPEDVTVLNNMEANFG
jgi:hypothetical protein